ncbi:hypothetical protein LOTGIDRAFT_159802 [Lottia gigantea]|uniref:G-protein coupled receptors family 1 profile domain-containing protein n=1 Tax=Lottia gigantea TaxID=225164 RepID=V3ZY03_LOTGI|nr:hypothetical protein LOTGIDRAFT_159802 [Lottia gigantea]ESO96398.1 hypothetical protein LOTGIDRAFT_159802 [Lottia gigantea]
MEDTLHDLKDIAHSIDHLIENGPLETKVINPENIGYVSGLCILAVFGTLGNVLILIMFSKKEFSKTSYSIYIRSAAISDTIFMLMNISEDVMDHVTSYSPDQLMATSYGFCIFWSVTKGTFRTASPWIVVALALDRCVAIWKPLNRTRYCTKKTAEIITAIIILTSLGVELGLALPFTTMLIEEGYIICADTGISGELSTIKRLVTETGLPCITMLIPNLLVIIKIQQSLKFRRSFSTANDQKGKVAKSARPLLVVSCLAFITLLPISITEVVELSRMNQEVVNHEGIYYDDYYHNDDFDHDYPDLNRNNSHGRMFNDSVFNFPNGTLDNIISRNSSEANDESVDSDLIESTNLRANEKRNMTSDLIENTTFGTNNENNVNSDLFENTRRDIEDADDGVHDEMNEDDLEKLEERGENQESEVQHLGLETREENLNDEDEDEDEDEDDFENNTDKNLLDTIWKACNFIYMCNFSQNFYLLMLSSKRYRASLFKMFYCGRKKYALENQPQTETISSSVET